jgi:hypothetical protein
MVLFSCLGLTNIYIVLSKTKQVISMVWYGILSKTIYYDFFEGIKMTL